MTEIAADDCVCDDARARSNVWRLAAAQALTGANAAVIFATGSIVGATMAPSISLATVPLSVYGLGIACGTLPTGFISRAYGRRVAFIVGTGCGTLTGVLGAVAILTNSFALFCVRRGRWPRACLPARRGCCDRMAVWCCTGRSCGTAGTPRQAMLRSTPVCARTTPHGACAISPN